MLLLIISFLIIKKKNLVFCVCIYLYDGADDDAFKLLCTVCVALSFSVSLTLSAASTVMCVALTLR